MNGRGVIVLFVTGILPSILCSQILLERQVLGVCAAEGGVAFKMMSTAGESVITTLSSPNNYLTQGFHQPRSKQNMNVLFSAKAPCGGLNNGVVTITELADCPSGEVEVLWNGEPGNLVFDQWGADTLTLEIIGGAECSFSHVFVAPSGNVFCALGIYNLITPNGDGLNDKWTIENIQTVPDNSVIILNRSGGVVWQADAYDNDTVVWKGNDQQDRLLPNGTYFFLIEAQGQQFKGFLELLR